MDGSFSERYNYYATQYAHECGYDNLGQMAAEAMRTQQTNAAGAGPALAVLFRTIASYF